MFAFLHLVEMTARQEVSHSKKVHEIATILPNHVARSQNLEYFFRTSFSESAEYQSKKSSKNPQKMRVFLDKSEKVLARWFLPFQNGTTIAGQFCIFYASLSILRSRKHLETLETLGRFSGLQ